MAEASATSVFLRYAFIVVVFVGAIIVLPPVTRAPQSHGPSPATSSCDLGVGRCRVAFDEHHSIELEFSPLPLRALVPLTIVAGFGGHAHNPRVTIAGTSMTMGVTTSLAPQGRDTFSARSVLPVCTADLMHWSARVDVDLDGEPHTTTFAFSTRRAPPTHSTIDLNPSDVDDIAAVADAAPANFTLTTARGPLHLADFRAKVVLLYFGYTFCPDVCPTSLAATAAALRLLTAAELERVQTIFVSVDPARDTVAHLDEYAAFFHPSMIGATGTPNEIAVAATPFGVYYEKHVDLDVDAGIANRADYSIDHSGFTYLIAPGGRLVARLPHAVSAPLAVTEIRKWLKPPTGTP